MPDSPLDVQWTSNAHLAVTQTARRTRMFEYNASGNTFNQIDLEPSGLFHVAAALLADAQHALRQQHELGRGHQRVHRPPSGQLTFVEPRARQLRRGHGRHAQRHLLYAGGISGDGNRIYAYTVAPDGSLTPHPASSFTSPGESPKDIAFSGDDRILIAGHGTDATVQTFLIDPVTGSLTHSGFFFDVGTQGNLGDIQTLGNLLFVTHEASDTSGPPGILSFRINPDGSLTQNGPILGYAARPEYIATWQGFRSWGCSV